MAFGDNLIAAGEWIGGAAEDVGSFAGDVVQSDAFQAVAQGVALVYPPAQPVAQGLAAAKVVLDRVEAGDPQAQRTLEKTAQLAANGSPEAMRALDAIESVSQRMAKNAPTPKRKRIAQRLNKGNNQVKRDWLLPIANSPDDSVWRPVLEAIVEKNHIRDTAEAAFAARMLERGNFPKLARLLERFRKTRRLNIRSHQYSVPAKRVQTRSRPKKKRKVKRSKACASIPTGALLQRASPGYLVTARGIRKGRFAELA